MSHVEFKLGVTLTDLLDDDRWWEDCHELQAICTLLDVEKTDRSLAETSLEGTCHELRSHSDPDSWLCLQPSNDPTDSMGISLIQLRCRTELADKVESLLRCIQSRATMTTTFLKGDLGLHY